MNRLSRSLSAFLSLALTGGIFCSTAYALPIANLTAMLNQAQTVPTASPVPGATGSATVSLDMATNMLSWNLSWSGLSGMPLAAHFHGPATPGTAAGVQVNIGNISGLISPSIGSTVIGALQATDLLNGLWYINVHTSLNPPGEIRGQVVRAATPEPATVALLGLGVAGIAYKRRKKTHS